MFGSTVLEVTIGLTFCYGTVALIVATIQEALASLFRLRAQTLLAGVKTMLNDPGFSALAQAVYAHPLVNPHGDGGGGQRDLKSKPSYIEPANFAIALVDSIARVPGEFANLGPALEAIPDPQLRQLLLGLYRRAGDLEQFQQRIAAWFDNTMERTSGAYKRRQMLISFLISLLLAIMLNIDSIHLFQALWLHPATSQINGAPGALDQATLQALLALPIGWTSFPPVMNSAFALQVAGWLMTAATTLFGAPFWFDLLQRAVQMRGTGSKPEEKRGAVRVEGRLPARPEPGNA
jgi:hypothetical protein